MAINTNNPNQTASGCMLRGCLIATAVITALFISMAIYMWHVPSMRERTVCQLHMIEVAAAISRYTDVNGHRPSNLHELAKEYLKDPSVLRCPLDKSGGDAPSYIYNPKASDSQIMLECNRHRLRSDMPKSRLVILGNGTFKDIEPSVQQILDEARKRAEK